MLFVVVIYVIAPPVVWVLLIALPVFIIVAIISGRMMQTATKGERQAGIGRDAFLTDCCKAGPRSRHWRWNRR